MIDEYGCRLHEHSDQRNGRLPDIDLFGAGEAAEEDDDGGDVDEVFGEEDSGSHIYLQGRVIKATRLLEGKPGTVDDGAAAADEQRSTFTEGWMKLHGSKKPAMVGGQRRIVQPPPVEVVEIPLRHWEVFCDLHPVPLGFKIPMHRRGPETRIPPQSSRPPEEAHGHQNEGNGDPL